MQCTKCGAEIRTETGTTYLICQKCHKAYKRELKEEEMSEASILPDSFPDTLLAKRCYSCDAQLTLMASISPEGEFLVERCLHCGVHPVTEIYKLKD